MPALPQLTGLSVFAQMLLGAPNPAGLGTTHAAQLVFGQR